MFADTTKAKAESFKLQAVPPGLMKKLGHMAYTTYRDTKTKLPPEDIAGLAAKLYGQLQEHVQNIDDMKKSKTLPLLKLHLKRRIIEQQFRHKSTSLCHSINPIIHLQRESTEINQEFRSDRIKEPISL